VEWSGVMQIESRADLFSLRLHLLWGPSGRRENVQNADGAGLICRPDEGCREGGPWMVVMVAGA
jgi:hypothetical protein